MVATWNACTATRLFCARPPVCYNSFQELLFYFISSRYSVLPAISLDGILHLDIQDRAYTGAMFNQFIDLLLDNMNPYPQNNSVIVMDNASIHKSPQLRGMIEERCVTAVPMFLHTGLDDPLQRNEAFILTSIFS